MSESHLARTQITSEEKHYFCLQKLPLNRSNSAQSIGLRTTGERVLHLRGFLQQFPVMLGVIASAISLTCEAKSWKTWLDYIMKKEKKCGLKKVALYHCHGHSLATTSGFRLPQHDIMWFQKILKSPAERCPETVALQGITYVIKSVTSSQLIAFNGSNYLIVSRSKSIVIITLVKSRDKAEKAKEFLMKIIVHLVKQNH